METLLVKGTIVRIVWRGQEEYGTVLIQPNDFGIAIVDTGCDHLPRYRAVHRSAAVAIENDRFNCPLAEPSRKGDLVSSVAPDRQF